jgi:hypothetical protein
MLAVVLWIGLATGGTLRGEHIYPDVEDHPVPVVRLGPGS